MSQQISTPTALGYVGTTLLNEVFWTWIYFTDHVTPIRAYVIFQWVCFVFLVVYHMTRSFTKSS
jgi:hypothetical protein